MDPRTVSTWLELLRSDGIKALLAPRRRGQGSASWLGQTPAAQLRGELKMGRRRWTEEAHRWLKGSVLRVLQKESGSW